MKHRRFMLACSMALFAVFGLFSFASAGYNLSLQATSDGSTPKTEFQPGDDLYLNVLLDDPTDVAGCVFTLVYPADVVTGPATTEEFTPVTPGDIVSSFPFTYDSTETHRENASEPGKIYFSGAAINTTTGGGLYDSPQEIVLFTVKFTVKSGAPFGHFQFSLAQTELWNLDAGYGTDNNTNGQYDDGVDEKDAVPVLVGAVDNQDPNWDNLGAAFPVLLGGDTTPFTPLPLVLLVPDDDSIDNDWEIQQFGDLNTADDTTDFDGDGYLDRYEQPDQNNTDPMVDDAAYALPHYDPATDDRGPYQVASMAPKVLPAPPESDIALTVTYDVSDEDNTLGSFGFNVHFDSTKLDYTGYENFFETNKTDDPAVHDDIFNNDDDPSTDKFILLRYRDLLGQSWPDQPLPLDLITFLFSVKGDAPLGITQVNVTKSEGEIGYTFAGLGSTLSIHPFNLDVDGNGVADALTDGILILRYLFGFTGDTLVAGAVGDNCTPCTAAEIETYLGDNITELDVDVNGTADALTDGILILRYLFGFTGDTLVAGAVGDNCTLCTAAEIEAYLQLYMP
ncbi:MAG: hypothetical protein SWQ30_11815 [Thermodesulfobacteriota bacterium]|nr:hypothetical protein [Thermodesulfobacteriota bacterium]